MPLPWTFTRNLLVPVRLPGHGHVPPVVHVRVYSDRWGGDVVLLGQLEDQAISVSDALPRLWATVCVPTGAGPLRCLSYVSGATPEFRGHRCGDDHLGTPVPAFPDGARTPRDPSAAGVYTIQHGPRVDVWDPVRYRLSTFQLAQIRQHARRREARGYG